jgi:8-oxo-dGTP pyrophosphatase MutT (NUDIX family)
MGVPPPSDVGPDIAHLRRALGPTLPGAARGSAPGRAAAVAAIFREARAGLEVLFIQRAERAGDPWSGHMAFPGGRFEPTDADLLATAVRETHEEIGLLLLEHAELVGVLEDQEATAGASRTPLPTRPFVFELRGDPPLVLSSEVTEIVWTPVGPLYHNERPATVDVVYGGMEYALPGWHVGGQVVWGLTYRMMSTLFSKLR